MRKVRFAPRMLSFDTFRSSWRCRRTLHSGTVWTRASPPPASRSGMPPPARGSLRRSIAGRSLRTIRTPSSPWAISRTSPGSGGTCGLTRCLVATAEDYAPEDARFVSENKWRAIRRGLDARLYDFETKEEKGARETARALVDRLRPVSQDLGCETELEGVLEILHRGTGAELQRAAYKRRGSLEDVVDYLLETTASA